MVHDTYLLDFVDGLGVGEGDQMWADGELLSVEYLNTLLWYVHPCAVFALEVHHIETLEPVVLELRVFSRQSYALDL